MWNPLGHLPPSNAGALSGYAPGPIMTPGGGTTGAPLQPSLHPIYTGGPNMRFPLNPGAGGPLNGVADPNGFRTALQGWLQQRPSFPMGQFGAGNMAPLSDWRSQFTDWMQARPLRSGY